MSAKRDRTSAERERASAKRERPTTPDQKTKRTTLRKSRGPAALQANSRKTLHENEYSKIFVEQARRHVDRI